MQKEKLIFKPSGKKLILWYLFMVPPHLRHFWSHSQLEDSVLSLKSFPKLDLSFWIILIRSSKLILKLLHNSFQRRRNCGFECILKKHHICVCKVYVNYVYFISCIWKNGCNPWKRVYGNDLGRLGKEMQPRNGQIKRSIAHSYILGGARSSGGTLPKLLGYKGWW